MTDARLQPTPARFRALARSSPWRWSSIQFEWKDRGTASADHVWIHRPTASASKGPTAPFEMLELARERSRDPSIFREGSKGKWLPTPGIWPLSVMVFDI